MVDLRISALDVAQQPMGRTASSAPAEHQSTERITRWPAYGEGQMRPSLSRPGICAISQDCRGM